MKPSADHKLLLCFLITFFNLIVESWMLPAQKELDPQFWNEDAQNAIEENLKVVPNTNVAKNVIMFLGDGMGIPTITAGRIYKGQKRSQTGEEASLTFDKFKDVALIKTYNVDSQVPDSAGTATAFLSGVKSNAKVVGLGPKAVKGNCESMNGAIIDSILDWSQQDGKATGFVTTSRVTHASPAGLFAHCPHRDWESDDKIPESEKKCKDIARQLIEDLPGRDLKVILGGGRRHFYPNSSLDRENKKNNFRTDGRNLVQEWMDDKKNRGSAFEYVSNLQEFENVNAESTEFLMGLFEHSNMNYELDRNGDVEGEPSLAQMTEKAIQMLSRYPNGFFLFVEGPVKFSPPCLMVVMVFSDSMGSAKAVSRAKMYALGRIMNSGPMSPTRARIDHAHHDNYAVHALEETLQFDDAVKVALDKTNKQDTLIVVTADHDHAVKISGNQPRGANILGVAENSMFDGLPYTTLMYSNGPGYVEDSEAVRMNYTNFEMDKYNRYLATVPRNWSSHGGEDVQVFAQGPMSHLFRGVQEQSYIPHVMAYASCVGRNKKHCAPKSGTLRSSASTNIYNSCVLITILLLAASSFIVKKIR